MYHSITFGEKNSYDDWHLVLEERPSFQPPEEQTTFLSIPGMNGSLDISEALTGYPLYGRRTGSFEFTVLNDYQSWHTLYREMSNYLHNKKLKATLEDEPDYYYEGRFYVTQWKSDHPRSKITVQYEVQPYKKYWQAVDDAWKWDPFSFEDGIITTGVFKNITVASDTSWTTLALTQDLYGDEPICPTFKVTTISSSGMKVRYVNKNLNIDMTKSLSLGENYIPEIIFAAGDITLYFIGKGTLSITFHKGTL